MAAQPPAVSAAPLTFILLATLFRILCNRFPEEYYQTIVKLQKMENQPLKAEGHLLQAGNRENFCHNYRAKLIAFHR